MIEFFVVSFACGLVAVVWIGVRAWLWDRAYKRHQAAAAARQQAQRDWVKRYGRNAHGYPIEINVRDVGDPYADLYQEEA